MTREAATQTQSAPTSHPLSQGSILQRKCSSCGQHKTGGGACTKCQSIPKPPVLQTKLTVGQPNDKYEQEADRVAEQIMRMPAPESAGAVGVRSQPPQIQRKCAKCDDEQQLQMKETPGATPEVTPAVASRIQSLQGGGQPLSDSTRSFFEPRFGQDFSHVRVHNDVQTTQALNAKAYTVGNNIVFGSGQYSPETSSGKQLLAHELTHTVQQTGYSNHLQNVNLKPQRSQLSINRKIAQNSTYSIVQRACGTNEVSTMNMCIGLSGDVLGETFRFVVNCDNFQSDEESRLRFFASTINSDEILEIHGFASEEGPPDFNNKLSCARAEKARQVLIGAGIAPNQIRLFNHGATAGSRPERRSVVIDKLSPTTPPPTPTPTPPEIPKPPEQTDDTRRVPPLAPPPIRPSVPIIPPIPPIRSTPSLPPSPPTTEPPSLPPPSAEPPTTEPPSENPPEPIQTCGPNVTHEIVAAISKTRATFAGWSSSQKDDACTGFTSFSPDPGRGGNPAYLNAWDIENLHNQAWINSLPFSPPCASPQRCQNTVEVSGNCFYAGSANYVIFGTMWNLCRGHFAVTGAIRFSETTMLGLIDLYKGRIPGLRRASGNWIPSREWARAGYRGWSGGSAPAADRPSCQTTCPVPYTNPAFTVYWYPNGSF